jgi:GWxTD domain-containing protein
MIKRLSTGILGLGLVFSFLLPQQELSPVHRRWLEDVSPILTKTEREVFLQLTNDRERDVFIRFFWRTRDPVPDTEENEYQKEYQERVRFADQNFGHGSSRRGSQTERGFYYLALGPPLERSQFTTQSELWPQELWFYKGEVQYGLPDYFYLVFYQPQGVGEFRLYYPGIEGPEKLIVPMTQGRGLDRSTAYQIIRKNNAELASASLSYLPGERPVGFGSSSSDTIIASISRIPETRHSDSYARSFLSYKEYVETEYLDMYTPSAFQMKVLRCAGLPFVHWSIEPDRMNFGEIDGEYQANFEFVLRVEDLRKNPVFEKTEEIPLRLTSQQYKAHEKQRFAFQDLLPLIPGEYKLLFLIKNKTGKDFSSHETQVAIPVTAEPGFSSLLLHHGREAVPSSQGNNLKAFVVDGYQYIVGARNEFLPEETMGVFAQAPHIDKLSGASEPSFVLEISPLDGGAEAVTVPLSSENRMDGEIPMAFVTGSVPLSGFKPGYYQAEIAALNSDGREAFREKDNFIVLAQPYPILPWIYGRLHGPALGAEHLYTIGTQYFLTGDYELAKDALERALALRDVPAARLLLAKTLYGLGRFRESLDSALGLFERTEDREAGKVVALSYAGLEDWASALATLEKLLAGATEIGVLNLAAECQMNLDRPDRALPLLQKSLALLPDQPAIKALEERAKKLLDIKKRPSFF